MRALRTTVALVALSLLPLTAGTTQPLSPLIVNWEQYFTVQQQSVRDGRAAATVWNTSGWNAQRIQVLVEALDGAGQARDQRVVWLGSDLPAGTHAHVDMSMSPGASYRVSVFAFNLDLSSGPR
jgi:hypothetical protein